MNVKAIAVRIAKSMNTETCRTCRKNPKFEITGSDTEPKIELTACCESFKSIIDKKFRERLETEISNDLSNDISDIFKRL